MFNENWEIKVVENIPTLNVYVYLFQKSDRIRLAHFVKGQLEVEEIAEGSVVDPEPTMKMPLDVWNTLKRTMIDDKVRDKSEVEAELKSTNRHLEDMRKIVFKKLGIKL